MILFLGRCLLGACSLILILFGIGMLTIGFNSDDPIYTFIDGSVGIISIIFGAFLFADTLDI